MSVTFNYCVDDSVRQKRKKSGGNKKQNYTEGWVEFADKRIAKTVALMLNNNPVGGKKRSYYHDDLWNIKYLTKFKWSHITEKIGKSNYVINDQRLNPTCILQWHNYVQVINVIE